MKGRHIISIGFFLVLLFMPLSVFAVDFEIQDVQIDVYLKENGQADVVEKHNYEFDSKFNGVTREIFPKTGSSIVDFKAYDDGTELKVEQEDNLYKIYRSGKNETVDFSFHYTITDTVEKYEDGTQFYFSFFSDRNETDYRNMTIVIHPPKKALDVDFIGYHTAYGKGQLGIDGIVTFSLGEVPAHENGDVRVVYESTLFPGVETRKGNIRHEIKEDERQIEEEKAAFLVDQDKMQTVGSYTIPAALFGLLGWVSYMFIKRRSVQKIALSTLGDTFVPENKMSLPALIQFTMPFSHGPERMSAALLDLIRQGYVKQVDDATFELVDSTGANRHETALIDLLFRKAGDGEHFSLDDLETYTKNKLNHKSYSEGLLAWQTGIREEVKNAPLYENKAGLRWIVGFISIAFVPIIVQLGRYELYPFMTLLILFALGGLITALFYYPKTKRGFEIKEGWKQFQERMEEVSVEEWEKLPADDKYRAYIYGIGAKNAHLNDMYEKFERAEKQTQMHGTYVDGTSSFVLYNPVFMTSGFTSANTNASVNADGNSSSGGSGSIGGGGVGGSGGGSGAF